MKSATNSQASATCFTLTNGNNAYTAIAQDSYNRKDTNSVVFSLPSTVNYVYDLNGNLTSDSARGFDYDDENQLMRVTVTNTWKSEFTYDGRMRRRIRKEYTWQNSAWVVTNEVRYIYDGNLEIQWRDGNNLPTLTLTRGRDLGGSLQGGGGIGGLLARTDAASGQTAYFHADGNGNVTCLINGNQTIVAKYIYDPFGNTLSKSGMLADANIFRFSSKEYHANSGLYYYGYRFYDPNLQRWLNRDPIMEQGGMNLYTFARNRRPAMIDSFGFAGTIGPAVPPAPPGEIYPLLPTGPLGDASDIANFEMGHAELPEEKSYYLGEQLFDAVVDFLKHVFGAHPEPPNPNPPPPATPVPVNCPAAYPKLPTPAAATCLHSLLLLRKECTVAHKLCFSSTTAATAGF